MLQLIIFKFISTSSPCPPAKGLVAPFSTLGCVVNLCIMEQTVLGRDAWNEVLYIQLN